MGQHKMLGEAEGVQVWEGGSEGILGVLEALVGSVRKVRGAHASWQEHL